jgi:hypothetical protein
LPTDLENERLTLAVVELSCSEHLPVEQPTRGSEHRRERHAEAVHVDCRFAFSCWRRALDRDPHK